MNVLKLLPAIKIIFDNLSPDAKEEVKAFADRLAQKAAATKHPFDDMAVMIVRALIGV